MATKIKYLVFAVAVAAPAFFIQTAAAAVSACEQGDISNTGACQDEAVKVQKTATETKAAATNATGSTDASSSGFAQGSCRAGYFQVGARLCMTARRGPTSYANAEADCRRVFGSVADYGTWRYRGLYGDGVAAPVGWWLGPITADNRALFVNLPNTGDFDGETSRFDSRYYACAHDDNV